MRAGNQPIVSPYHEVERYQTALSCAESREHENLKAPQVLARLTLDDGSQLRVISAARRKAKPKGSGTPFAVVVHKMVTEMTAENPNIMTWVSDGEAFSVDQKHPGLGPVLAKYFHRKFQDPLKVK